MIPKIIKIGGMDYTIIRQKQVKDHRNYDCLGLCEPDKNRILLKADLVEDKAWEVLIHECLHAIEEVWNVPLGEKKVHTLGHAVYAFLKDNNLFKQRQTSRRTKRHRPNRRRN